MKNPVNLGRSRYFFLRRKQNSPITSHARPTIKNVITQLVLVTKKREGTRNF